MAQRGSYAKGVAKREEILERTLDVIATEGYDGASVKRIAEAVGLSQAGLLHYFDSKEELFTEVLRKRDEHDGEEFGLPDGRSGDAAAIDVAVIRESFLRVIRHNTEVPGLVELFSRLAVEAANPEHPAHDYFLERGEAVRDGFALTAPTGPMPPDVYARILQAVADGLQLQWLVDPTVDMAGIVDQLLATLQQKPASAS